MRSSWKTKLPKHLHQSSPLTKNPSSSWETLTALIENPNSIQHPEKPLIPLPTISLSLTSRQYLIQFLKSHLDPSSFSPQQLLHFLKNKLHHHPRFSQFDVHIFRWASEIDSFRHDHTTYEWMIRTLAITDRFDDLSSIIDTMVSNPCPCSDEGIFSCPQVENIFRFAINAYCRVGRFNDAVTAFKKMCKSIDGKPNVILYNVLMSGFVRFRMHEKAVELYNEMVKDRVKPDVFTFNILIDSYCRNSMFELALNLFRELRKTVKGCDPNVVTFNTLIGGLMRERKFEEGIRTSYEMLDLGCGFSIATCEILFNGLVRQGRIDEACNLFIDFYKKGAVPSGFDCFHIVDALCGQGEVDKALEVINEFWEDSSPSVVACTTMVEALKNARKIDDAYGLMQRMLKNGILPDSVTFNCLLQALCDVGRTSDANRLRVLASSKGLDPDGATYKILVSGFSREGNRKEGESLVYDMLDGGFVPDIATYNRLMDGLSNRKKFVHHARNSKGG